MSAYLPTILNSKKFKLQKMTRDGTFSEYHLIQLMTMIEPFYINDLLFELIADTKQVAGVEVIKQAKEGPADGSSSDTDDSD